MLTAIGEMLGELEAVCNEVGLVMMQPQPRRVRKCLDDLGVTYTQLIPVVRPLRERVIDELEGKLFFFVPAEHADYYQKEKQFGPEVETRFPGAIDDISEAGKCIAIGRHTAAVFHLMRVMEIGVQEFATKLKVAVPTDKAWGVILREIDDKITKMASKTAKQKEAKNGLGEVSVYLHHVKDVWRNPTMHPKNTYTEEEALRVFSNVKQYMQHLLKIL